MDVYSYPSLRLVHNLAVFPIVVDYLGFRIILKMIQKNIIDQ